MSATKTAGFQGMQPVDVLVSYVLYAFANFSALPLLDRVRIRFLFEEFAREFITPDQFLRIASFFPPCITTAAQKLIQACISPGQLAIAGNSSRSWTHEETILLLAGSHLDTEGRLASLIPARAPSSWRRRINRVIEELRLKNLLTDNTGPTLAYHHNTSFTLTISESYSMSPRRTTQGVRLMRAITELQQLKTEASAANARHQKQLYAMERAMTEGQQTTNGGDEETHSGKSSITTAFMIECDKNVAIPSHGRRYSDLLYDISELLRSTSRKSYRLLREILPLPSETALYMKYVDSVKQRKKAISDIETTKAFLDSLFSQDKRNSLHRSPVTIGIDAFSFRTFNGVTINTASKPEQYSSGFLFVHIPLDPSESPMVVHLKKKSNGSYDDTVANTFQEIREVYAKSGVPVWFKATDGDRYLTSEHDTFYEKYVLPRRRDFMLLVQKLYKKLCKGVTMPIPDPLHYGKNLRGKIVDHQIAVVHHDETVLLINSKTLQDVLQLGDVFDDRTNLGRMRDVYVTKLFTLRNVCKLLEKNCYAEALLLLPYSCIFTVLYGTNLLNSARMFLVKLAYLCFDRLLDESESLVAHNSNIRHRFCSGIEAVTLAEPNFCKRMLHSCLALGICLRFGPRTLRLDAIGTHIVENSIGIARSVANSTKYTNILSAFAHAELRKEIARTYNIKLRVPRRVNDGGAKVDTLSEDGIEQPETWDAFDIVSNFVEACNKDLMEPARADLQEFLVQLKDFTNSLKIAELSDTSEVANALIVQRNYNFKSESIATALETPP